MTKSEFVDQVASKSGLSKKDAGTAVDAVLNSLEDALRGRRRGLVHGLRQVPRRAARRPRGPQPAHRRDDADRGEQGPALHRRLGPQEGRQVAPAGGALSLSRRSVARHPVRRPARRCGRGARVADRARDRPRSRQAVARRGRRHGGVARAAGAGAGRRRALRRARPRRDRPRRRGCDAAAAVLAHCLALIDAAGPGVRRGQAAAGLLRAARLPRLGRARGDGRARARARACS